MKEELMSFTVIKDEHESLEDVDLPSKLSKKKKKKKKPLLNFTIPFVLCGTKLEVC